LVLWFGPQIVQLFGGVVMKHWAWFVVAIVAGVLVWLVLRQRRPAATQPGQ
jgi:hypothetical protein